MELARRWLQGVPPEVSSVIRRHPNLTSLEFESAEPECLAKLDDFGSPRCHDLLALGEVGGTRIVIGVEGKADESFGPTIAGAMASPPPSNRPERVCLLVGAIFGIADPNSIGHLRYQLLHGLAGTLVSAATQQAEASIFLIHEFLGALTTASKVRANAVDLENFVAQVGPAPRFESNEGFVVGPFRISGGQWIPAASEVYIAKATVHL